MNEAKKTVTLEIPLEGQIFGVDPIPKEELNRDLTELADLYTTDRIEYDLRRHSLWEKLGGKVRKETIDNEVMRLLGQVALPEPEDGDPVNELVGIGHRDCGLWHNPLKEGFANLEKDGHVEIHRLNSDELRRQTAP